MARSGRFRAQAEASVRLLDAALYPEPVSERVRAARCLLRHAEEMLRAEVGLAAANEEVPLRGETEEQILDRLIKSELGLAGVGAARLLGRPEDFEDAERHAAERRENQTKQVFNLLKAHFMKGFKESGAHLDPQDEPKVDQMVRRTLTAASTDPALDSEIIPVNAKIVAPTRHRRKRAVVSGEVMSAEETGEKTEKDPAVVDLALGRTPASATTTPDLTREAVLVSEKAGTAARRRRR